jgi:N-carbamoylputrescine amidase
MALKGAEIIFYPTAIGSEPQDSTLDSREHWCRAMQGHSGTCRSCSSCRDFISLTVHFLFPASNLVPVIASNRIGQEKYDKFYGNSFITDATGAVCSSDGCTLIH